MPPPPLLVKTTHFPEAGPEATLYHTITVAHHLGLLSDYVTACKVPIHRIVGAMIPSEWGWKERQRTEEHPQANSKPTSWCIAIRWPYWCERLAWGWFANALRSYFRQRHKGHHMLWLQGPFPEKGIRSSSTCPSESSKTLSKSIIIHTTQVPQWHQRKTAKSQKRLDSNWQSPTNNFFSATRHPSPVNRGKDQPLCKTVELERKYLMFGKLHNFLKEAFKSKFSPFFRCKNQLKWSNWYMICYISEYCRDWNMKFK